MTEVEEAYCLPILYPNGVYDPTTIFRNERLPLVRPKVSATFAYLILFAGASCQPLWVDLNL